MLTEMRFERMTKCLGIEGNPQRVLMLRGFLREAGSNKVERDEHFAELPEDCEIRTDYDILHMHWVVGFQCRKPRTWPAKAVAVYVANSFSESREQIAFRAYQFLQEKGGFEANAVDRDAGEVLYSIGEIG
jgi:hypothetical protein